MLKTCDCCKNSSNLKSDLDIWCDNEQEEVMQPICHQAINPNFHQNSMATGSGGSSSTFLPMEFIQILIHQHAKTLIALKTLRSEVRTLKKPHPPPPHPQLFHPFPHSSSSHPLKPHPHLSHPHPPLDSGLFSTKSSSKSSSTHGDELYSLLSQIQDRITCLKTPPTRRQPLPLGYLDNVVGNGNFDFSKFQKVDRAVVKAILNCDDLGELKRQLLFCHAKVESMEPPPPPHPQKTTPPPPHPAPPPPPIKSLTSLSSTQKSLIPVPIARIKKKSQITNNHAPSSTTTNSTRFLWGQWFN
ncbi:uncharacterized protein LOC110843106 [Folsomia candida]|uniref:uncharacterized protein LOC110843106 n=1 Tax=Folsomia candida TaxID=158441 RepID=UPI000B8F37C6|nr:uncharacterized protein LOC110843106 [Folsomia candida]